MGNEGARHDTRVVSRGAAWSAADFWLQQSSQLLTFIVVGGMLGPEAVGLMTMALTALFFLVAFIAGGFSDALIQRADIRKDHFDTAFWLLLGIGVGACLVLAGSAPLVAWFFSEPELTRYLQALALALPFIAISAAYQGMLQRELRFRQLATRSMIAYSTGFVVALVLARLGFGVWSLVASVLVGRTLDALLLMLVSGIRPGFRLTRAALADIVSFGKHRVGHQVVGYFIGQFDRVIIGFFLGPIVLGFYSLAERIVTAFTNGITGVVARVAFPVLSGYQRDEGAFRASVRQFVTWTSVISLPIFLGLSATSTELLAVLLPASWLPAAPILKVLCLTGLISPLTWVLAAAINACGRSDLVFRNTLVVLGLRVVAGLIAVQISVLAVAIANVVVIVLSLFVLMAMSDALFRGRWPYFFGNLWVPLGVAGAMVALTMLSGMALGQASALLALATKVLIGVVIYVLGLRLFASNLYRSVLSSVFARS
jgi:PST family polysaccharide transporter